MKIRLAATILMVLFFGAGCAGLAPNRELLYQTSTLDALLEGDYQGRLTIGQLKRHGDFGIGTLADLDGELAGLDGRFYQVRADGKVFLVPDEGSTPFAAVTFFEADRRLDLTGPLDYEGLKIRLDREIKRDLFGAVKISGRFRRVKTRSVPKQARPYPPLAAVTDRQPVFEFQDLEGVLVGFYCPEFVGTVNAAGYHLHFLAADLSGGGHLLDCELVEGTLEIDYTPDLYLALPGETAAGRGLNPAEKKRELERVEK
ncbi:MAG TPA: acetolactate decarboxylase [bacterium]|uniref:Alpha-acetolactate decarboxylase n=1 Tax=candidate division TA06 bacterium ADurb.Bin417 TaxID=1852828 RepID=A0A1V5MAI5_UNCT6|nr:MAG: Alpha-acetolactate decarboxylase precursor [candidate division TA06 bacterium ADurb.Bin417]HNQ35779.1 acetolactate decarboxylase [bacterium]HNS49261.1 acetolactate decarboxylase [bacterium]